jgi:hypothetical protein
MPVSPRSVIHVGFTNTGTTSLQLNFFSRRNDIFYVGVPYHERGGIFSHILYLEDFRYDESYVLRCCNKQILTKSKERIIVISDETLCDTPQLYFAPYVVPRDMIALRLFRLFQPAKIIFTIRRQEDYISSMYLNLKRNSAFFDRMPMPPLSRWYKGMLSQIRCNYLQNINFHEIIAVYEQIFDRENILVLPLEKLIVDGPTRYLQQLCDFMGVDFSDNDVDHFALPRNVRMSELKDLAGELLTEDRFFAFYTGLQETLGRGRLEEALDSGRRAVATLNDDTLADLKERVGSGNRLLAEEYGLDLERYGYTIAAAPAKVLPRNRAPARETSLEQLSQLRAIIETERHAHATEIAEMDAGYHVERQATIARIEALDTDLDALRTAQANQIADIRATHDAERESFVARIRDLERELDALRAAQANLIADIRATHDAEREAFVARIRELEATHDAEREAFVHEIPMKVLAARLGRKLATAPARLWRYLT